MSDRGFDRGWRNVVEDAIAAGALNDLIVATDFLEHLRAQANMARGTETIACRDGNREALARTGDLLEQRDQARG